MLGVGQRQVRASDARQAARSCCAAAAASPASSRRQARSSSARTPPALPGRRKLAGRVSRGERAADGAGCCTQPPPPPPLLHSLARQLPRQQAANAARQCALLPPLPPPPPLPRLSAAPRLRVFALDAAQPFDFESRMAEQLSKDKALAVGIVGFGTFGQFLAKRFASAGHRCGAALALLARWPCALLARRAFHSYSCQRQACAGTQPCTHALAASAPPRRRRLVTLRAPAAPAASAPAAARVLATSRTPYYAEAAALGVEFFEDAHDFCEEHPDVVILATSILSTEPVLRGLPLTRLKRSTLIVDVLSVKVRRRLGVGRACCASAALCSADRKSVV